jgi:hypothetical protein
MVSSVHLDADAADHSLTCRYQVGPWATVTLEGASSSLRSVLAHELAPASRPETVDLMVRVQDPWIAAGPVTRLGRHGGFDREGLFLCDRRGERLGFGLPESRPAQDRLPLTLEPGCWRVTTAFDPWELLRWIERWAHVQALERGGVWIHAAAVAWEGEGWLFPAWGGAGKTDLLGAALRAGARYYADDWAAVETERRDAGTRQLPICTLQCPSPLHPFTPSPLQSPWLHPGTRRLNLRHDNWQHWPERRRASGPAAHVWRAAAFGGKRLRGRVGRRLAAVAEARLQVRLPATALFAGAAAAEPVPLRRVAMLVTGDRPGFRIERCDAAGLPPRIAACHAVERRLPLDLAALARFGCPDRVPPWAELPRDREAEALARALADCDACIVTVGSGSDPNAIWRRLTRGGW